ncbi:MAG: class B sortase [Coriobacteriales bacterium]|jgi:sortase B|nr:class B sortase [Coriobacteriales bacterium]
MNAVKKKPRQGSKAARVCFITGCALAALVLVAFLWIASMNHTASKIVPQGPSSSSSSAETTLDDGFPYVDWEYWQGVNPNIVAWLTVPDTGIDTPIVQASSARPTYYLTHDVFGSLSYIGCPYVNAQCTLESPQVVILGHNIKRLENSFAALANYREWDFANTHQEMLFQTPGYKLRLNVLAADVIPGSHRVNISDFASVSALRSWISEQYARSDMKYEQMPQTRQVFTFVTCSYVYHPRDERTLVYTSERTPERTLTFDY